MTELPDDLNGWAAFFAGHRTVVFVANSETANVEALRARFGEDVLFVFFNKVYKVLSAPFTGSSLLVARSSVAGANIVYRREVDTVCGYFAGAGFNGILNLKAVPAERFSAAHNFGARPVGRIDLSDHFAGFYPEESVPTTGFALAIWLAERCPDIRLVLAGFSADRSERWKLFHDHDWTFEQIVLRLMARSGRIEMDTLRAASPLDAITARFPDLDPREIALVACEVLASRQDGTNRAVDRLYSIVKPLTGLRGVFQRLKPKTRKEKQAVSRR
ncbi:3-deoxy-manno-octulosonate cytidylyltransferase [Jiella sp. MQZ9-1]|uniref:3-deoxy-manno-octulosonate cytidylyltransferase n=1 Tax=Jiella flava TaxID=2816857 RepID=A0A939G3G1_9HYPH|nr:3-deoxy-manno-octulosonate cytidylyltransferase [Jiella flava]MBO0664547.1 3-deoxy-manno-octulosonate cytidylyltransferase [Jiella flava]MCD2473193.1 3-deoxy-manno-octulosonate cytidylyltransferase [Jiella flava]